MQRTVIAERVGFFAIFLGKANQKSVVLIKKRGLGRQFAQKQLLNIFITGVFSDKVMTKQDAIGVSIHHEHWLARGIKGDGVGGLRANAVDTQQFLAKLSGVFHEEAGKVAAGVA